MKFLTRIIVAVLSVMTFTLAGCNSSDDDKTESMAKFSLGVSDAPVDDASVVSIEIDTIKLTNKENNAETLIETFTNDVGETVETIQVNLLDYQGFEQLKIVDEAQAINLNNDTLYTMELIVIDAGSYVMLENDPNKYDIKVPSSRLKLGEFTATDQAQQVDQLPAYTIEFDLRQSLVLRGNNPAKNGYIIKPHAVRIVSLAGNIAGTVSADNTNLGACSVYVYEGEPTELGDIFDANDETFIGDIPTATAPLATTLVADDSSYSIGFLPEGSYTVALRCGTDTDDNIQFDGLVIPTPEGNSEVTSVSAGVTTTVNF